VINPTQVRTELGGEHGASTSDVYDEGDVSEPDDVAEAILFAAERQPPNMVSELGFYRRDALADMT
jgi:NADP-dependent 3-hydroxy acid dehydrogenase YdfG